MPFLALPRVLLEYSRPAPEPRRPCFHFSVRVPPLHHVLLQPHPQTPACLSGPATPFQAGLPGQQLSVPGHSLLTSDSHRAPFLPLGPGSFSTSNPVPKLSPLPYHGRDALSLLLLDAPHRLQQVLQLPVVSGKLRKMDKGGRRAMGTASGGVATQGQGLGRLGYLQCQDVHVVAHFTWAHL